ADGAMYFTVGGRGAQSELFRVTYVGKEPTERVEYKTPDKDGQRELRKNLEAFHAQAADPEKAVKFLYESLHHKDRFIRYAARVALEHQPVKFWQGYVAFGPDAIISFVVALARQGNKELQPKLLDELNDQLDFAKLSEREQLDALRAYQLVFTRMGEPDKDT